MPAFFSGDSAAGRRTGGARSLSGVAAGVRRSQRGCRAAPAAEPEPVCGSRITLRRIVFRGLVRQQWAANSRPALDAARCLRSQRRRHQVACSRRPRAGTRRAGRDEHRHRPAAERSGRHGRRPGVPAEFPGSDAPRVRFTDGRHRLGARARGESRGDSRCVRGARPAVHRVRRGRIVGDRRRSGVEERVPSEGREDGSAGLPCVRVAAVATPINSSARGT